MSTTKERPVTKVITGKVRFSYAQVFVPAAAPGSTTEKYSVSLLIPKDDTDTLDKIERAIKAAMESGKSILVDKNGNYPKNLKMPLRDGDDEKPDEEAYAGHFFLNATSQRKPEIIDKSKEPITTSDLFYSGCYGRASINFYAFNKEGNRGIAVGLNNLQKLHDGPNLTGATSAEEDFDEVDDLSA